MASVAAFLGSVDTGIAGAVRTCVARAHALKDLDAGIRIGRSVERHVGRILLAFTAIVSAVGLGVPWASMGLTFYEPFPLLFAAYAVLFAIGIRVNVGTRVLEGVGKAGTAAFASCAGPIAVLLIVLAECMVGAPLALLVLSSSVAMIFNGVLARALLNRSASRPRAPSIPAKVDVGTVVALGGVSLAYAFSSSSGYFVVSSTLGLAATGEYAVPAKLAQGFTVLAGAAVPVLWTYFVRSRSISPSHARISGAMMASFCGLGLVVAALFAGIGPAVGERLGAGVADADISVYLWFAAWGGTLVAHQPLSMFLNDSRHLRVQFVSLAVTSTVSVVLGVYLASIYGIVGPVAASFLSLACIHVPILVVTYSISERREEIKRP